MKDLLDSLNRDQLEAVRHDGGPLLIIAGPGTGKTRTLAMRIAWLVRERGVMPENVLAVTFSNRAANELEERLSHVLPEPAARRISVGTFHAICWQVFRREIGPEWSICPEDGQRQIVRDVLVRVGVQASGHGAADADRIATVISRLKARLVDVASTTLPAEATEAGLTPAVGRAYQEALAENSLVDSMI